MSVFYGEKGSRSSGAGEREPQADGKGTYDRILSADEYDKYRLTQNKMVPTQMPPEQGFSSRELITWIQEEVRESQRVKQAFLQECTETLAAICVAIWERLGRGEAAPFWKRRQRGGRATHLRRVCRALLLRTSGDSSDGADGQQLDGYSGGE